jgi:hypothetical protein
VLLEVLAVPGRRRGGEVRRGILDFESKGEWYGVTSGNGEGVEATAVPFTVTGAAKCASFTLTDERVSV